MPSYINHVMVENITKQNNTQTDQIVFFIFLYQEENFESILLRAFERFQTMKCIHRINEVSFSNPLAVESIVISLLNV